MRDSGGMLENAPGNLRILDYQQKGDKLWIVINRADWTKAINYKRRQMEKFYKCKNIYYHHNYAADIIKFHQEHPEVQLYYHMQNEREYVAVDSFVLFWCIHLNQTHSKRVFWGGSVCFTNLWPICSTTFNVQQLKSQIDKSKSQKEKKKILC